MITEIIALSIHFASELSRFVMAKHRDDYSAAVAIAFRDEAPRIPDVQQRANSTARGLYSPRNSVRSSCAELAITGALSAPFSEDARRVTAASPPRASRGDANVITWERSDAEIKQATTSGLYESHRADIPGTSVAFPAGCNG